MKYPNQIPALTFPFIIALLFCFLAADAAWANPVIYVGTNGVSATTNWSDTVNFIQASSGESTTPANNATSFSWDTAVASPGLVTVHANGPYSGQTSPGTYNFLFEQTNGYHTVLIDPGIQLQMEAAAGTAGDGFFVVPGATRGGGGGSLGVAIGIPYTNHTVIEGGGSLWVNGKLLVQAGASANLPHYSILDMSGLNTFLQTNTAGGSSRFELGDGTAVRSQGLIYLATNNFINIYSDMQIGYNGNTYSNSLPIGLYLGQSNVITTGPNDNGNQLEVAMQGVTNAFIRFNPAFLGGATMPTVYLSGNGTATGNGGFPPVSGMMAGAIIGEAVGASVPSYGVVDFTGGQVTWLLGQLDLGVAGTSSPYPAAAVGVLTFNNGTITVNNVWCGWQQYSANGANGASPGIGIINIGSNATFHVNNTLWLAVATNNSPAVGTAGTINVNGGTLAANIITNGGGNSTIALTNATLQLTMIPNNLSYPQVTITNLVTGGTTNTIAIDFSAPATSYPFTNRLVSCAGVIGGAGYNFGLEITNSYVAQLVTNSAGNEIDLVVSSGPVPARNLSWSGTAGNGNWDVAMTANWLYNSAATTYNQSDLVRFDDTATGTTNVNLTTVLTPASLIISNNLLPYTFGGSGHISGTVGLNKQGSGTLVLDESSSDNYSGGVTISGGTVQVGNNDTGGSLPTGTAVNNNGALVFDNTGSISVNNGISGSGSLTQEGGGTLLLSGLSTFTGPVLVTNNSELEVGGGAALGNSSSTTTVASGSTLDAHGYAITNAIIVSGAGVGGNGAIVNSGGSIFSTSGGLTPNLTLTGDTTFGIANRWDLSSGVLSSGGQPYTLTLNAGSSVYFQWDSETVDTNLGDVNLESGTFALLGSTTLGNPAYTLSLAEESTLDFYGPNVTINKTVDFNDGANILNSSGNNVMSGAMTLEPGYCTFDIVANTTLTISNVLSGSGVFYQNSGPGTAILDGDSPSFTGGVLLYDGQLTLNGAIGSGITTESATTLSGAGTADGFVDVSGAMQAGSASTAGTFTADDGLTLESSATLTMNLSQTTGLGGGTNSLIAVNGGTLTLNGNNVTINPIGGTLADGTYTLITYTGSPGGSLGTVSLSSPSRYSFAVDTSTPNEVNLVVSGQGDQLVWNNGGNNGQWDVQNSFNWSNLTTSAEDQFLTADSVVFDDSILNAAHPTTSINIASGVDVMPGSVSNNSTSDYTISGTGEISGGGNWVKLGASTLTITGTNNFTGNFLIGGGTVRMNGLLSASSSPVGSASGTLFITNGATLTVNLTGSYPSADVGFGSKPIVVSGAGIGGNGAIQNIGNSIYNDDETYAGLGQNVTMAGNTTIGGTARWDWGYPGLGVTLSTGGSNYNLIAIEPGYSQWSDLIIDTNLGNFDFYTTAASQEEWLVNGMGGSLGNPTNILTLHSNVLMDIQHGTTAAGDNGYAKVVHVLPTAEFEYQPSGGAGDYRLNTSFVLESNSTAAFYNVSGGSGSGAVINGSVTLNGIANLSIGGSAVTFSNVIGGTGGFSLNGDNNTLVFAAANTYQGETEIGSGMALALVGNGSISDSAEISLASGAILAVTNRVDGTLTLAGGQTLQGSGVVQGALAADTGSAITPGTSGATGTLTVSNNVALNGDILLKLNHTTNDVLSVGGTLTYGGTLTLTNISVTPLAAGNSFKLFSAGTYQGAFTTITPATPGAGLLWSTSSLITNGTLQVVAAPASPRITSIALAGGNIIISGTNNTGLSGSYQVLTTTNLALPLSDWLLLTNGTFNSNGNFYSTNAIGTNDQQFYILEVP